jgi:hypothetical protein
MKIILFVEGRRKPSSEEKTIKMIARKKLPETTGIETRIIQRGDLLKEDKVYSQLVNDVLLDHPDAKKVVICIDAECEREINEKTKKVEQSLSKKINIPIFYVVVVNAVEGWLLADIEAVKYSLGRNANVNISPSATLDCKPKELLKDIFRKADRDFIHMRDNPKIAEEMDVDKAARNNQSLAYFVEKLIDP